MKQATINGKPIQMCASAGFNAQFAGLEAALYCKVALQSLAKKAVDMLVFETFTEDEQCKQKVRCAGYALDGSGELDEETVLFCDDSLETPKFWFKVDDYGEHYVGTFLFPDEY